MFKQALPKLGLSLEMATDAVPDDGMFHVLLNREDVLSTESKPKALAKYRELRRELIGEGARTAKPDPEELLRKLRADAEVTAVLAAASRAKRAQATRKR